jgi:hypothetical protein
MRKLVCTAALTLMAAALPVGMSATPARAATTWTVSPGGSFTASGGYQLVDTSANNFAACASSSTLTGSFKSGSGLSGSGIGRITSLGLDQCGQTGPLAWRINANFYHATSNVASGNITKIHFAVSEPDCTFVVDGTGDTADNGMVRINWYNTTKNLGTALRFRSVGSTLHAYDVNGCFNIIHDGDTMFMDVRYGITPRQMITSP